MQFDDRAGTAGQKIQVEALRHETFVDFQAMPSRHDDGLKDVLTRLPTYPNRRIGDLLPHRWKQVE